MVMSKELLALLSNAKVQRYIKACEDMQSPEILKLFRQLPERISFEGFPRFTTDLLDAAESDGVQLMDDDKESISKLALAYHDSYFREPRANIDIRALEASILDSRDKLLHLSAYADIQRNVNVARDFAIRNTDDTKRVGAIVNDSVMNADYCRHEISRQKKELLQIVSDPTKKLEKKSDKKKGSKKKK